MLFSSSEYLSRCCGMGSSRAFFVFKCIDPKCKRERKENVPVWNPVNKYVLDDGTLIPFELLKHVPQTFYPKTKGGVDGATQCRSTLCSFMVNYWGLKIVTKTMKTIAANSYISWKINRRFELLSPAESLKSLDIFIVWNIAQKYCFWLVFSFIAVCGDFPWKMKMLRAPWKT